MYENELPRLLHEIFLPCVDSNDIFLKVQCVIFQQAHGLSWSVNFTLVKAKHTAHKKQALPQKCQY